jgi:hypothetical protein
MPLLEKLSLKSDKRESDKENGPPGPTNGAPTNESSTKEQPPSYTANDPADPSPEELNRAFNNLKLSETPLEFPEPEQCLAHLKLLFAFHALKEDIGYTDGIFNLWNSACEKMSNRDEALAKMREKRWALYIARAVERFETWWITVLCAMEPSKRLECKEMVANNLRFAEFPKRGAVQKWTAVMLPPLGKVTALVLFCVY